MDKFTALALLGTAAALPLDDEFEYQTPLAFTRNAQRMVALAMANAESEEAVADIHASFMPGNTHAAANLSPGQMALRKTEVDEENPRKMMKKLAH